MLETNITKSLKIIIISEKENYCQKKNDILHSENVNSGLTYAYTEHNQILLYREEEFVILIHELFHAFVVIFILIILILK